MTRYEFVRKYPVSTLNSDTTAIIAFHDDNDGAAAARIALKHLIECGYSDRYIWPMAINSLKNAAKNIAGAVSACENLKKVIIVDVAISSVDDFAIIDDIASLPHVGVDYIDHHLSSERCLSKYKINGTCAFHTHVNVDHSATFLAWDMYFTMRGMPAVYKLVDDHDLYKNEYQDSLEFFKGSLRLNLSKIKSPCAWDSLEGDTDFVDKIISEGKSIVWYENNILYPHIMRNARRFILAVKSAKTGKGCLFGNCVIVNTNVGNYELFGKENEYDFAIKEYINNKGEWAYTLYSNKYDTTIIGESCNGGGHAGISGFTADWQVFKIHEGQATITIDSDRFGELFLESPIKF